MINKKSLVMILAVTLIMQVFSFATMRADDFIDIGDTGTREAARVLNNLGIMKGKTTDSFMPDTAVRRGEMVSITMRMLNLSPGLTSAEKVFSDVSDKNASFSDIYMAYKLGIVSGSDDGKFLPEKNVTYAQAIKMIICALGYEPKAESMGGYPTGYLTVAAQLGLFRGVTMEAGQEVTRGNIAKIAYKALEVDLMQKKSYGNDDNLVEVIEGQCLLTEMLGCHKIKGVVTENELTSLTIGKKAVNKEEVLLAGTVFYSNETNIKDYLGYKLEVYYKTDELGRNAVVMFTPAFHSELVLTSENDISVSLNDNKLNISYYVNEKQSEQKAQASFSQFVYNGKAHTGDVTQNILDSIFADFTGGKLTLVDNDGDKTFDFIKIEQYTSAVVSRVDTLSKKIYYKVFDGSDDVLAYELEKLEGDKVQYTIYALDGKLLELAGLKENDVISVYKSEDNLLYEIWVSTNQVAGAVNEVGSDGEIVIKDSKYNLAAGVSGSLFVLGLDTAFYLDKDNNIAGFNRDSIDKNNYGLLMDVFVPDGGLTSYPRLRILTPSGGYKTLESEYEITAFNGSSVTKQNINSLICNIDVAPGYTNAPTHMLWYTDNDKNFTYDGGTAHSQKAFYYRPWLTEKEMSDIASRKPIYYETNSKGRISKILVPDIPEEYCKIKSLHKMSDNTVQYAWTMRSINMTMVQSDRSAIYRISENAVCYDVLATTYSEKDYKALSGPASIANGSTRKSAVYEIENSGKIDMVVRYNAFPIEGDSAAIVVVDSVAAKSDDSYKLTGFSGGSKYESAIPSDVRLVERKPYIIESTSVVKLTASNLKEAKTKNVYDLSLATGSALKKDSQYVDETSLKKGDIVFVAKNGTSEVRYVEVIMRAEDAVLLTSSVGSGYSSRMSQEYQLAKGCITGFVDNMVWLRSVGEYTATLRRDTVGWPNYALSKFFDENQLYNFAYSSCKVWEYDLQRGTATLIPASAITEGDMVLAYGKTYSPRQCIVLKNYKAEPNPYDYWIE